MTITAIQQPTLFFIRHGKLALPYENHAAMPREVLVALGLKKLNPSVEKKYIDKQMQLFLKSSIPLANIQRIYTSPSRRCIETGNQLSDYIKKTNGQRIKQVVSPNLREIYFELDKILHSRPAPSNTDSLNNAIISAMSTAHFCESADSGLLRITSFFAELHDFSKPAIIVAHDFIMRIVELFIRHRGTATYQITIDDLLSTQRNDYLRGFATDSRFAFLKKI
ncbi:MAG: phosphoglycerate mutase family protein [Candidatus Magasanikbacteria bacterium]|nr:phosphoglycerate mutase family protein [Candidatus Magasanikbacteria bacterium]